MAARYFSVEEANALLPDLEPIMAELLERKAKLVKDRQQAIEILQPGTSDMGGPIASQLVLDFIVIERLIAKIKVFGCIVKDLNAGLIDFLSERDGREVYLCWRFGEPSVEFYHELHTGFMGRQHL